MRISLIAFVVVLTTPALGSADDEWAPFVIPADVPKESRITWPAGPAVAPAGPRVEARDGHLWLGRERFRVWGVNLCFGGNVMSHEDSARMAARLAAFGINSVRIHHLDSSDYPRGIWDSAKPTEFSAEALDRLDYLIDQLARRGIRVNLNLHVGREFSRVLGLPERERLRRHDKMVNLFVPQLIEAQRDYARRLLSHVNAYRKVRYADDAAIAFVEINNEDGMFMWGWRQWLWNMPEFYAGILRERYQAFLKQRYVDDRQLAVAWAVGAEPMGASLLPPVDTRRSQDRPGWQLEQHAGCRASTKAVVAPDGAHAVRIQIDRSDATAWHLQYNCGGPRLEAGRYYTVRFRSRADKDRDIEFSVSQAHEPWKNLGLSREIRLGPQWKEFRAGFEADQGDDNARLSFMLSGSDTAVELADATLAPGDRVGLAEGESLTAGGVALFADAATPRRQLDEIAFLAQVEKDYYDGLHAFIKQDLGCRALVTGTIVFGPASFYTLSGMDYIDAHAYWQHPRFPGRPWDPSNWLIEQKAMVDHPEEATLLRLAASRLAGKPFTVSEYNHPAPNDCQAECVPLIASFGAAQDWDGVWLFSYTHRAGPLDRDRFDSFFDIDANPAKWGFVPAGAAMFRAAAVLPFSGRKVVPLCDTQNVLDDLAALQIRHNDVWPAVSEVGELHWRDVLSHRLYAGTGGIAPGIDDFTTPATTIQWTKDDSGKGTYRLRSRGAEVLVTHGGGQPSNEGLLRSVKEPGFAAVTLTAMDGKRLTDGGRILLTACGRCENTDMRFSEGRRTVGRNWGRGPVRIEPVTASLQASGHEEVCRALSPQGAPAGNVSMHDGVLSIDPRFGTMWYLLESASLRAK